MAGRASWKGYLKLSLVSCPIALYPAITDAHRMKFRQVNRRTGNRLRQQMVDTVTGETVQTHDKGRGYEIDAHRLLPVEDSEIQAARAAAVAAPPRRMEPERPVPERGPQERAARSRHEEIDGGEDEAEPLPPPPPRLENDHTIDIERFVPRDQIDPAYYDKAYFIVPREPVGQEAFAVIRNALGEQGMVALGHVILSSRQRPIAIEAFGKGLRGFVLRHRHEVRSEAEYFSEIPDLKLPREMLDLARHILQAKTGDFEPAFLEDRYQQELVRILRRKQAETSLRVASGGAVRPSRENVVSIMDALKRSLKAVEPQKRPPAMSRRRGGARKGGSRGRSAA